MLRFSYLIFIFFSIELKAKAPSIVKVGWIDFEKTYYITNNVFHGYNNKLGNCLFDGNYEFTQYPSLGRLIAELKSNNVNLGIYLAPDKSRNQLYYLGNIWGKFNFSMYRLKQPERKPILSEVSTGVRLKSYQAHYLKTLGYKNILEIATSSSLVKMLMLGHISAYFEADILFYRTLKNLKLEPSLFNRDSMLEITAGTYANSDFIKNNPEFESHWQKKTAKCEKFRVN